MLALIKLVHSSLCHSRFLRPKPKSCYKSAAGPLMSRSRKEILKFSEQLQQQLQPQQLLHPPHNSCLKIHHHRHRQNYRRRSVTFALSVNHRQTFQIYLVDICFAKAAGKCILNVKFYKESPLVSDIQFTPIHLNLRRRFCITVMMI